MSNKLTREERYQIYIDRYVGVDEEDKNDGSGETVTGKRSMKSFLCRKRVNDWFDSDNGEHYADRWLDEYGIPRTKET